MSRASFSEPPLDFGPASFWFMNHRLKKDEITRQLTEMKAQGIRGFFLHPRLGMQTPHLSAEWFEIVTHTIEESRRLGLKPWLYDEDPYPSGMAGGRVVWDHPEYKARTLSIKIQETKGGDDLKILLPAGRPVAAFAYRLTGEPLTPNAEHIDLSDHFGTIRDRECSAYWPRSYYPMIKYHPHSRSESSGPRLAFHWRPPEGKWKVFIFVDEEYSDDGTFQTFADLMRPEVVRHFLDLTHEEYYKHYGDEFDKLIPGIFTDEPKVMGLFPWTGEFLKLFQEMNGYDLRPFLPALCEEMGPRTAKIRCDYRTTILRLLNSSFFQQIHDWCDEHKLRLVGHVSPEEDPLTQAHYLGNLIPLLKNFHIPGTDLIIPRVGDRKNAALNLGPKLVSSVAHQAGKRRVMCETFGASGWELNLSDMRWITDWLYVLGVNMMVPHGLFYSVDSIRKIDAAPSLFFHQPWWQHHNRYASYVRRLSYMLTGGKHVCNIAILYPIRSMWGLMPTQKREATQIRNFLVTLTRSMLEIQRDFAYLDEDDLQNAAIDDSHIVVGPEQYRILILPRCRIVHRNSIKKIQDFIANGGIVIAVDALPHLTPEAGEDPEWAEKLSNLFSEPTGKNRVSVKKHPYDGRAVFLHETKMFQNDLQDVLDDSLPRDAEITSRHQQDIFVLHRSKNNREIYFVANTSQRDANDTEMSCPMEALPQRWDPTTGKKSALPHVRNGKRVSFSLPLAARSSSFVVFDRSTESNLDATPTVVKKNRIRLTGKWSLTPESDNVVPLRAWEIQVPSESTDWKQHPLESAFKLIPYDEPLLYLVFGPAPLDDKMPPVNIRYRSKFRITSMPEHLLLVGEQSTIRGKAKVTLNSQKVKPFIQQHVYDPMNVVTDITRAAKKGINTIEVEMMVDDPQGGLLEPLRIFGDFEITAAPDASLPTLRAIRGARSVECGTWTEAGFPFYSGTCCYEKTVTLKQWGAGSRLVLCLPKMKGSAEVTINDRVAGVMTWTPYELDITDRVVPGENRLTIRASNTAANMLDLDPKPSGLLGMPVIENRIIRK